MNNHRQTSAPSFWSATYRGREIAAHRHSRGWLVYVDRVMQENTLFVTIEDAAAWLQRRVDCLPGLART
jgi:hypothetical protein